MIVGLYTSRIMLKALGVDNYGIKAAVGGIVAMTGLITNTMSGSISRFLTYGLGKGNKEELKAIFSTSINAQLILSVIIVVALETIGVWFLNTEASIPEGRMIAANWVLQCSIVITVLSLVSVPYNSLIIAHEHMAIYAYMSIVDVVLKLAIVYAIIVFNGDRLILLSLFDVCVSVFMRGYYQWYCKKHFEEAHYNFKTFDKKLLKKMTAFSGWTLLGTWAWIFNTQGSTMLVNVYYGVAYNAARGFANAVNSAIQSFVTNFTTAFTPQLTKCYAAGQREEAFKLTNRGTKFTWLLMLVFIVPVFIEADSLLDLWLGEAPAYSALFLRFAMFESLAFQTGGTLLKLVYADGRVKKYQIAVTCFVFFGFPTSWLIMHLGGPVWTPYAVFIFFYSAVDIVRFYVIPKTIPDFSIKKHIGEVLIPCFIATLLALLLPLFFCMILKKSLIRFCILIPLSVLWVVLCAYYIGLTKNERVFVTDVVRNSIWNKICKKK